MRKPILIAAIALSVAATGTVVFADSKTNQNNDSIQYLQMFARFATIEVDAARYNPAGTAKMKDGLYMNFVYTGAHDKSYATDGTDGKEYQKTSVFPVVPAFQFVYKKNDFAGYFHYGIPSGGGAIDWKNGSPLASHIVNGVESGINSDLAKMSMAPATFSNNNSSLKGSAVYQGIGLGGAYAINDLLAVSAGARYVFCAVTTSKVHFSFDYAHALGNGSADYVYENEKTAAGYGATLGLNISPSKELNIGFKYESVTKLEFKTKLKQSSFTATGPLNAFTSTLQQQLTDGLGPDGKKERSDFPHNFALGVQYQVTPDFLVAVAQTYYLQRGTEGLGSTYDNATESTLGFEYAITKQFKARCGTAYCNIGINNKTKDTGAVENAGNDMLIGGLGVEYQPIPDLFINVSYTYVRFLEFKNTGGDKVYTDRNGWGLSASYKFL